MSLLTKLLNHNHSCNINKDKHNKGTRFKRGFSLMELMIVIAIIALLAIVVMGNYFNQIKKGRDARRKTDLDQLRTALEDYADDNNQYPAESDMTCGSTALRPWIKEVPCEPGTTDSYLYLSGTNNLDYCIYTQLQFKTDPDIQRVGCDPDTGCPNAPALPSGAVYNFGVCSGNRTI
jgi:general secretion pathway protein G